MVLTLPITLPGPQGKGVSTVSVPFLSHCIPPHFSALNRSTMLDHILTVSAMAQPTGWPKELVIKNQNHENKSGTV